LSTLDWFSFLVNRARFACAVALIRFALARGSCQSGAILMTMRTAVNYFIHSLALLLACAAQADARPPNVVIFFTDDQGTLDAKCYGSQDLYTPHIDRLAATGVRFTQAYAHQVCCPARAMLLTGRHPQRGGVTYWTQGNARDVNKGRNMFLAEVTLAEVLRDAGYRTALFGKWHLGAHLDHGPTAQGFETFFGIRGGFIDNYNHYFLHRDGYHDLYEGRREVFADGQYFPELVTQRALQYIDHNKDAPFLLYVAFNIPHYPEQPDPKFDARYEAMPMPRQAYAKMISTTDDHIGRILQRLEQHGLGHDTIVVFMSDNGHSTETPRIKVDRHRSGLPLGTPYGAHGGGGNTGKWRGQKGTFFEGGLRVPAIIRYTAKLPQGVVRDQAITAMDWMPTILELCELRLPDVALDGVSLLPVLHSASAESPHPVLHWQWGKRWAVREGPWKLVGKGGAGDFLGNLDDPQPELHNHLDAQPERVQRLEALHRAWRREVQPEPESLTR
jgi:arylsulfatase A